MSDAFLMKGKVYGEHKHKLVFPVYAEIKYDEIRLHVKRRPACGGGEYVAFESYAGKPLHNLEHWADAFLLLMKNQNIHDLDLGVEVNGNFNDSYRWVRSSNGIPKEKTDKSTGKVAPALNTSMVKFILFDCPQLDTPFRVRKYALDALAAYCIEHLPISRPAGKLCHSEDELDAYFIEARERGFEGLMVKQLDHTYQCGKRIDGWLKMKPEETFDGQITKINRAYSIHGEPLDRAGSVDVQVGDGSVASPAGIPHALGAHMWAHPGLYVDQWIEFKAMERDRAGGYRHPSLVRLREAK